MHSPGTNPIPANVQHLHMNDDLLPSAELAGDLLDGNAGGQAHAAGADDAVITLAEQFRALRRVIADVPPVPDHQREGAIAAALAVFDAAPAAAAATAPVVPLARRNVRRWYQVASIAAAVAAIGVIGTIAIDRMGGNDFDAAGSVETSAKEGFNAERTSADQAVGGAAESLADTTAAAADSPAPESAPVPTIGTIGGPADFLVPVSSPAELRSFAQQRMTDGAEPSVISSDCPTDGAVVIAAVRYQGVAALVWVDSSSGDVQAVDATTCVVLETVTP